MASKALLQCSTKTCIDTANFLDKHITNLNNSKVFLALMIIMLNITSKRVDLHLSPSMESYFKHTFSQTIFVFCIAFMGCRHIYSAVIVTALFMFVMYYLFNENSSLCVLPKSFCTHHITLMEKQKEGMEDKKSKEQALVDNNNAPAVVASLIKALESYGYTVTKKSVSLPTTGFIAARGMDVMQM